jgi:hypothetical protein
MESRWIDRCSPPPPPRRRFEPGARGTEANVRSRARRTWETVVVVDEAAMVGTTRLARPSDHAARVEAKARSPRLRRGRRSYASR